jgi:Flp pilus assembly protein TadG
MEPSPQPDSSLHGQRGGVAILFVLCVPLLLGFAALAVDLARIHLARVELQNAADAAALAGARALSDTEPPPGASDEPYNWPAAATAALDVARHNIANGVQIRDALIETGYWNLKDPTLGLRPSGSSGVPATGDLPAIRVTVAISGTLNNGPLKLFFAPVLGIAERTVQASSIAVLPAAGGGTGIFPWVIGSCMIRDFWDFDHNCALKDAGGAPLVMDVSIESIYHEDCFSGTWSTFLDQDNSVPAVRDLIDHGNPANLAIGDSTWVQSGVEDALFKYDGIPIGKPVPIFVVGNVEPGSWQTIVAIAAFVIDDIVKINGKSHILGHLSDNAYFGTTNPGAGTGVPFGAYSPPVLVK